MTVDIITPSWNQANLAIQCLKSIREYTKDYCLIFVDNGSERGAFEAIYAELEQHPHQLVRNTRNLGFVRAVNQGLCLATAETIVLLNNDTEVAPQWIEKLSEPFKHGAVGAVGPVTTTPSCWQGREEVKPSYRFLPPSAMLAFFCVMLRAEVVAKVGLLDEDFGVGLADDDDYCQRIKEAGYKLALVQDLMIPHHHRSTFRALYSDEQIEAMTQMGLARYRRKYGLPELAVDCG